MCFSTNPNDYLPNDNWPKCSQNPMLNLVFSIMIHVWETLYLFTKGEARPKSVPFQTHFCFLFLICDLAKKYALICIWKQIWHLLSSSQLSLFSGYENGRAQVYDNVGFYCHFNGIPLQKLRDIQICRGRFKSLKTWDFAECFYHHVFASSFDDFSSYIR